VVIAYCPRDRGKKLRPGGRSEDGSEEEGRKWMKIWARQYGLER
jgi:hypothetical protein